MANIYLRLPSVIAAYHRNYDVKHKLNPFEPLKFSSYTDHAVILRGGLTLFSTCVKKSTACYSHQQWKNILQGKSPNEGKQVLKRDPDVWPTFHEVCLMEGERLSNRSESYDYLCIQMPKTILIGDREVRTNPSFSMNDEVACCLQDLLVRDFQRALIDWEIGTQDYCINATRIIQRGHMDTIERFLMRYDIPVAKDGLEKDSLRRQLDRWLARARLLEKAYRCIDIEYEDSRDKILFLSDSVKEN